MIVVDTNVVSELMRPSPAPAVVGWVRSRGAADLFTTSVTIAEILYGVRRLPDGRRRAILEELTVDVFGAFADQVLPFDADAASHYAPIVTEREREGRPIGGFDAQIAAICRSRGATLATRNVKDFEGTGIALVDPWIPG